MKDLLNYYYFIIPDKIGMKNGNYYFNFKNHEFIFYLYENSLDNVEALFNLNNYMLFNNYKINRIILNKDRNILTRKDNKYYVLVELLINSKDKISLQNIIEFNKLNININTLNRTNWYYLWSNKNDNVEYTLNHLKNKYQNLYSYSPYYIGLSENAISYLKYLNLNNNNIGVSHKRINVADSLREFYNPLNLVIDYKVRDKAEYYKSLFFNRNISVVDIINSIKLLKLSDIDLIYFYIRMLYPSFYFDMYDSIINGDKNDKDIEVIVNKQSDYEYLLYEIFLLLKSRINIVGIEWINKKFAN